jgi:uncharacterized coiled-coil protein SlyX
VGVLNLGGSRFLHAYGTANTYVGTNAGNLNSTAFNNTAVGYQALMNETGGGVNTAFGYQALLKDINGSENTAIGNSALASNVSGMYNTALGGASLGDNVGGGSNTAVGYNALGFNCWNVSPCNANYNSGLGFHSGDTNTSGWGNRAGANNTFLGAFSGSTSSNLTNATAVGYEAVVSASNALVLGSINGVNGATASVNVGIGTATPAYALDVVGDINASGCVIASGSTIGGTCSSDARLKTNVQPFQPSLDKLAELQPVQFNWRGSNPPAYQFGPGRATGLIAQEVQKVFPSMVSTDAQGYQQVNYSLLPFMLLEGVRELKARNDGLRAQLREQQEQIASLSRSSAAKEAEIASLSRQVAQLRKAQEQMTVMVARLAGAQAGTAKAQPLSPPTQAGVKGTASAKQIPRTITLAKLPF